MREDDVASVATSQGPDVIRIERLDIRNFKSIEHLTFEPRAINVLIGANGSGKSNLVAVFDFLRVVCRGELQDYAVRAGGASRVVRFGWRECSSMQLGIEVKDSDKNVTNTYEIALMRAAPDNFRLEPPHSESVRSCNLAHHESPGKARYIKNDGREAGLSQESLGDIARWMRRHLDRLRVFHFHDTSPTSRLRLTARVDDYQEGFAADGANLPTIMRFVREKSPETFSKLMWVIRAAAPFIKEFNLDPDKLNQDFIALRWRQEGHDDLFNVSHLSDGTLRFIALATLLISAEVLDAVDVIIIDEPELGLHPVAISLFAEMVKSASVHRQIIFTTQSPTLVDHFSPEDIVVVDRENDATTLRRLEPEPLAAWLEDYSLGQLWEKNLFKGRP